MFEGQDISAQAEAGASVCAPTEPLPPRQQLTKAISKSLAKNKSPSSTSSRKGRRAIPEMQTMRNTLSGELPQARSTTSSIMPLPADPELSGQLACETQTETAAQSHSVGHCCGENHLDAADRTSLPGQKKLADHLLGARQPDTDCGLFEDVAQQSVAAVGEPDAHQGQLQDDTQPAGALVGEITAVYRRYEDLRRARQRVELQAMATCRTVCGGDKAEGMKLYKSPTAQVEVWLTPYRLAMEPLEEAIKAQEKLLTKLGKQLPVREWADTVPGLSPRFLAAIVGECGIGPGEFKSVSALWKRMGMAVINGGRQRRVTGEAAIEHGYVPRRRALMWNIGDQVAVRQSIRNPKDDEGNSTGAVAINEWGALYLERKSYELARPDVEKMTPMHAHNRAKRYVEKRLLRQLWQEWRRASDTMLPKQVSPAA